MDKVKISMVIPTYTITPDLEEMAIVDALTYREQVDELIISEDGGKFSSELQSIADVYIYNKHNGGFTRNVNRGWLLSTGDYTMIVNSDTQILQGKLTDLCIPGKVTSPITFQQNVPHLWGAFFVVPKEIAKERGLLIEEMKTYASDSEYDMRVRDIFVSVPSVEIYHSCSQTVKAMGLDEGAEQKRDGEIYDRLIKEGKAAPIIPD